MCGCDSWTVKKAECQIIGIFEVWCWRRLLRVPWTSRRSNQSIERRSALFYLMPRVESLENTLMLGGIGGRRRRGPRRIIWLDGITDWIDISLSELWEMVMDTEAWHAAVHGVTELDGTEWLNWTIYTKSLYIHLLMDTWVCFHILALYVMLLGTLGCMDLSEVVFIISGDTSRSGIAGSYGSTFF